VFNLNEYRILELMYAGVSDGRLRDLNIDGRYIYQVSYA